jgi:excisionase family DNA binding protein
MNPPARPGAFVTTAGDRFISVQEAADYLNANTRTIRVALTDGRLRGYNLGPRVLRIKLSELEAALTPYGGGL